MVLLLLGALVSVAESQSGGNFLGSKRKVSSASVQAELNGVLGEVLGQGHGLTNERLFKIHRTLDPMFRSLPKNNQGHISSAVMRYAVRRYFSQSHGWIVKGFNTHEEVANISSTTDTAILQDKLPSYIRSILEERFALDGFSLDGVVAMVASLERLVFDEVVRGVELAFHLNSLDLSQRLSMDDLNEVLSSFLITELLEGYDGPEKHRQLRNNIRQFYPHWDTTLLFLKDGVGSDCFQRQASSNPFRDRLYSFEDAVRMAQQVSDDFGSWSNHECHEMKEMLMEVDVHSTGRVKLSDFYGYSKDGAWQFLEPSEQLRRAGVLDESSMVAGPQVMIPNYINSMSNCITSTPYYSICCLNECDQVFQQLEAKIATPTATPSEIIRALEAPWHYSVASISGVHRERLDEIARVSNGKIPLHGRLLNRWLHFVYPQECPYPHAAGVVKAMTPKQWADLVGIDAESATQDEIAQHTESSYAKQAPLPDAGVLQWNLEESLLESSTASDKVGSPLWGVLRIAAQIGMLVSFVSFLKPLVGMLRSTASNKPLEYDV